MEGAQSKSCGILELASSQAVGESPAAGPYPLSCAQESLWLVEQMAPGMPTYNLPQAWALNGPLDTAALQQSLDLIVSRHETLRTIFQGPDGKPEQWVLA